MGRGFVAMRLARRPSMSFLPGEATFQPSCMIFFGWSGSVLLRLHDSGATLKQSPGNSWEMLQGEPRRMGSFLPLKLDLFVEFCSV